MVGVDRRRAPVGHLVGLPVPGGEQRALLLLEDLERAFAGRPVDALPRHLQAPAPGGGAHLGEVPELGALEEALAHVGDAALDARLVAGPAHACRVADEAALAGVLEEAPREARVQRVGHGHGGREVVDDEVAGHALEERPGRLQTLDYRVQPLAGGRPDEAVPRVAPDHDQRPDRAAAAALGVAEVAEAAEVQLRDLARRPVLHAHGHRQPATPARRTSPRAPDRGWTCCPRRQPRSRTPAGRGVAPKRSASRCCRCRASVRSALSASCHRFPEPPERHAQLRRHLPHSRETCAPDLHGDEGVVAVVHEERHRAPSSRL